ncbi:MAG: protein kinase [Blautia sp.]|nr:protein kinase [Blautia sp.]
MREINGYQLETELKTTNSGFSKWGFARKNNRSYFIKELIDPVYPVYEDLLDPATLAHKRKICQMFEDHNRLLYQCINNSSDGNLVHIEDFFRHGSHYYMVMEKVDAISLEEVRRITNEDKLRICKALVHCLGKLHQNGIVHADIKLDNILFRRLPSGKVTGKVIDFDNCFWEKQPPSPDEEIHGDLVYMAPETFVMMQMEEGTITRAIDVFALGILFHQIFTGRPPGFDASKFDYPFEAVLGGERLIVSPEIPDEWRQLIDRMLAGIPEKRIDLSEAEALLRGKSTKTEYGGQAAYLIPAGDL